MLKNIFTKNRANIIFTITFAVLSLLLCLVKTGFEKNSDNVVHCRGEVVAVDNSQVQLFGMVHSGDQGVRVKILDGRFKGQVFSGNNPLLGQMDRDTIFHIHDTAFVILSLDTNGKVVFVNPRTHYRIGQELFLLALFAFLLIILAGWTGIKALLSFLFAGLVIWKLLLPQILRGWDPVWLTLGIVTLLTGGILFLVAGLNRKGLVAFLGSFLGLLTGSILSLYFTDVLHIHGAVMPFAEPLLYSGYGYLDLNKIFCAAVFLSASGAVMDLAMDVAASMDELFYHNPGLSRSEAVLSGMRIGRMVVGTMTTTLLLAYSGSYITLLLTFMAQGVPLLNLFNLVYVAAECVKTLVGSFGLITVAPFTVITGAFIYTRKNGETA